MDTLLARILVVDDDTVMLTFIINSLRRLGIQTIESANDGVLISNVPG